MNENLDFFQLQPEDYLFLAKNDFCESDDSSCQKNLFPWQITIFAKTDRGKYFEPDFSNQDCVGILISYSKNLIRIVTADGVSGSMGSEIASKIACETAMLSAEITPKILLNIQKRLDEYLPILQDRINQNFLNYSNSIKKKLFDSSLRTTIQVIELNLISNIATILKYGDGTILSPDVNFLNTQTYKTLSVSPFLSETYADFFNKNMQAVFRQFPLKKGKYIVSTDGLDKIIPDWVNIIKNNDSFVKNISQTAREVQVEGQDNLGIVIVEIDSISPSQDHIAKKDLNITDYSKKKVSYFQNHFADKYHYRKILPTPSVNFKRRHYQRKKGR